MRDAAVAHDAVEEKAGLRRVDEARGLALPDEVVGQGVDVEIGPGQVLHVAGRVQLEDRLGIGPADDAAGEDLATQGTHVFGGDAPPGGDLSDQVVG